MPNLLERPGETGVSISAKMPDASDLAETLLVLAGGNAGNAARYFAASSYRSRDINAALVWSQVAEATEIALQVLALLARSSGRSGGRPGKTDLYDSVKLSSVSAKATFAEWLPDEALFEVPETKDVYRMAA